MTDAEALYQVQAFLSPDHEGDTPREAIARVIVLAMSSVATMQRNVELEAQLERLQTALIQKELH